MYHLLQRSTLSVEIKKSRFVATCVPVATPEEAARGIEELRDPDATHNCWAWRVGDAYRFNDDGEPGGSAGRPMLAAIDGQEFDGVLAHVVRYFGGIKLGVGGLVRAYGNTVAQCLRASEKEPVVQTASAAFCVDFSDTYAVYGIITQKKLLKTAEQYRGDGVCFELSVRADEADAVRAALINATGGRIRWEENT